jgi:hypothetical protein
VVFSEVPPVERVLSLPYLKHLVRIAQDDDQYVSGQLLTSGESKIVLERPKMPIANIETQRLRIRSFQPNDWQAVYDYTSDPAVMMYIPEGPFIPNPGVPFRSVRGSWWRRGRETVIAFIDRRSPRMEGFRRIPYYSRRSQGVR